MIDHRLQVLRLLAEYGTVTAVAEALNYTPSAVSQQLRTLASELGVTLLVRDGRGVRFTEAGRALLTGSNKLFATWEELRAELDSSSGDQPGSMRLCGFSTAAAALLPFVATTLAAQRPHLSVRIIEADPDECFRLLLCDQADVAVVVATSSLPPMSDPRFEQRALLDDPLDLLVAADSQFAGERSMRLSDTANQPWILDRPGRPHHQLVMTACAAAGFAPLVAHEAAEWDTGAALVGAGLGVALVPRLARLPAGYPIRRIALRGDPTPSRHLLTAIRSGSRGQPAVAAALAALDEVSHRRQIHGE
ncbi:LysR family transcriptional regulator [Leekyejoonella antrihumi]|uniref:LysR family transcriptional regulator n=1 Tax=Leekyejoonella antrihumi TaxID=1660198 RepID=A0A563DQY8_9MICO|nr:LysR family transcriptional regulator [Leekyejoonella antrihumi]TWP32635.1 LysR family transcriptional regulator [Leekyejoonella antrihumi]